MKHQINSIGKEESKHIFDNTITNSNDTSSTNHFLNEYVLTPLEMILINKKMPHSIKLEHVDCIYSSSNNSYSKNEHQTIKKNLRFRKKSINQHEYTFHSVSNSNSSHKKQHKTFNFKSNNIKNVHSVSNISSYKQALIQEKCENVIDSIQSSPETHLLFQTIVNEELNHLTIARNVSMEKYKTLYELFLDLRKLWVLYLDYYKDNKELFSKTMEVISYVEGLWKKMENVDNHSKIKQTLPLQERPMNIKEKTILANHIRNLPEEQLKGLLNLLDRDKEMQKKNEYYEIDIEKLTVERLREVEKYVKSCMKSSKNLVPARYQEEFEHNLRKSENILKDNITNSNSTKHSC